MPSAYSSEFREMVLDQIRAGWPVAEPARELEIHQAVLLRSARRVAPQGRGLVR